MKSHKMANYATAEGRDKDTRTKLIVTILISLNTDNITYNYIAQLIILFLILLINDFTYNSK